MSTTVVGPVPTQCRRRRAPCTATSSSFSSAGRLTRAGATVVAEVVVSWAACRSLVAPVPQAESMIVTATAETAAMIGLVFMSVRLFCDRGTSAHGVDDITDRLAGLGGGGLVCGEHGVLRVGQR